MTFLIIAVVLVGVLVVCLGSLALVRRAGSTIGRTRRRPTEPVTGPGGEPPERRGAGSSTAVDVAVPENIATGHSDATTLELERPRPVADRLRLLRDRLSRSQSTLGKGLLSLLSRDRLDEATWQEIEDTLLTADVGVAPTHQLVERLRTRMRVEGTTAEQAHQLLREELVALVDPSLDRALSTARREGKPGVVMVVGVNGVGKTTTVGKIARVLVADDKDVLLGCRRHLPSGGRRSAADLG